MNQFSLIIHLMKNFLRMRNHFLKNLNKKISKINYNEINNISNFCFSQNNKNLYENNEDKFIKNDDVRFKFNKIIREEEEDKNKNNFFSRFRKT